MTKFEHLKNQKIFFFVTIFIISIGIYLITTENKNDLFLKIFNSRSQISFINSFFQIITNLGSCYLYTIFIVILTLRGYKLKTVLQPFISLSILVMCIYISKNLLFKTSLRPCYMLDLNLDLNSLEKTCSFPSGHSAVIFSLITLLVLNFDIRWYSSLLFLSLSLLVAYSRIFLGLHFFEDILVGALLGITVSIISNVLIVYMEFNYHFLNLSIYDFFKKKIIKLS